MEYRIHCTHEHCAKVSAPLPDQLAFIEQSAAKGMEFIALNCPECNLTIFFNPQVADGEIQKKEQELILCPCETCYGSVMPVKWKGYQPFWGCGECGTQWRRREDLDAEIEVAMKRHPYRAAVYRRKGDHFESIKMDGKASREYEKQVVKEFNK